MRSLNFRELFIAWSSIDAVSASVSMAFSDKDVLAARKLVTFGFITQLGAFIVEAVTINRIARFTHTRCAYLVTQRIACLSSSRPL